MIGSVTSSVTYHAVSFSHELLWHKVCFHPDTRSIFTDTNNWKKVIQNARFLLFLCLRKTFVPAGDSYYFISGFKFKLCLSTI